MKPAFLILSALLNSAQAFASVVLFTDSQHPIAHAGENARMVLLDEPEQLQKQFFDNLPNEPENAEHIAQSILLSPDWKQKEQQLLTAYQGVIEAYQLQLEKYPAVVFDGHYVVYGTADVAQAQQHYELFREDE